MKKKNIFNPACFILFTFAFFACNPAQRDWEKVKQTTNYSELIQFVKKYPNSENVIEAEQLIWEKVVKSDSAKGYEEYLSSFPTPKNGDKAKKALEEVVLFPTLGFVGDESELLSAEKLRVPEKYLQSEAIQVLTNDDFSLKGTFPYIYIGSKWISLSDEEYSGKAISTKKYGTLYCRFARSSGFSMLFFIGGTRAQRDAIYSR